MKEKLVMAMTAKALFLPVEPWENRVRYEYILPIPIITNQSV